MFKKTTQTKRGYSVTFARPSILFSCLPSVWSYVFQIPCCSIHSTLLGLKHLNNEVRNNKADFFFCMYWHKSLLSLIESPKSNPTRNPNNEIYRNYTKKKIQVQANASIQPCIWKSFCMSSSSPHWVSWTMLSEDLWPPFIHHNYTDLPFIILHKGPKQSIVQQQKRWHSTCLQFWLLHRYTDCLDQCSAMLPQQTWV